MTRRSIAEQYSEKFSEKLARYPIVGTMRTDVALSPPRCGWCNQPMPQRRINAQWCSNACHMKAKRRRGVAR